VPFGQSFHWADEQHLAETVYDMLEPVELGGAQQAWMRIADVGDGRTGPTSTAVQARPTATPDLRHDATSHTVPIYQIDTSARRFAVARVTRELR
jgi:hypothetical protein